MAARRGLVACLWWPVSSIYSPPDIDFDKVEIWPLSGGLANGVNVNLKATGIDSGEVAAVDFLTADYKVAFRFEVDSANSLIKRKYHEGGNGNWMGEETRGGYPFSSNAAELNVGFLRTRSAWQITVNGARTPWFDYTHRDERSVVYAAVTVGLVDGEIVDKRPVCGVACNAEECSGGCSANGTACLARIPSADGSSATCTADSTTYSDNNMHCCDGWQLAEVAFDAAKVGDWVRGHSTTAHVTAACAAFGSSSDCTLAAGNKVGIRAIDTASGMYTAWVPQLPVGSREIQIPPDVLADEATHSKIIDVTGLNLAPSDLHIELEHALINQEPSQALLDVGFERWWFVNMIKIDGTDFEYPAEWWLSYSDKVFTSLNARATQVYLLDEDRGHTSCSDDDNWVDRLGNTCGNYTAQVWCEDHGVTTNEFRQDNGLANDRNIDQYGAPPYGFGAQYTCCQCGGGFHEAPTSSNTAKRSVYFQ